MSQKSEYDAAYFTLLRAREELDHLRRYQDYLDEELERLAAFTEAVDTAGERVPAKYRKLVDASAKPVLDAVKARRALVRAERQKVPTRISDQEAFVVECEDEVQRLR
jgi:hypothetical protein